MLWFNGYSYKSRSNNGTFKYVNCRDLNCPGKGKTDLVFNPDSFELLEEHNHPIDEAAFQRYQEDQAFINDLKLKVCQSFEQPKHIYNQVAQNHLNAAERKTFISIRASMFLWRKNQFPPVPRTVDDISNTFNDNN